MNIASETVCPFCSLPATRIVRANDLSIIIRDAFPISPGHTLIIPRRHVSSMFRISMDERVSLFELLYEAQRELEIELKPDGYNIGINDGYAAGQTVAHLHIHLIPRFEGDCADPRGGVRWIVPEKAAYWTKT